MRPSLDSYSLTLKTISPGQFEIHRDTPDTATGETLVGSLWLRESGAIPEVALIEVGDRYRGKGIANAFYDAVESIIDMELQPTENLTYDGFRLWMMRDPGKVRESLYHHRAGLLGKTIEYRPGEEFVINSVRNESAMAKRNGITLPFSKADLRKLGLLPLNQDALRNWNKDNRVCDSDGAPIRVYHGSDKAMDHFSDQPTYFTPSTRYGYIQTCDVVYPSYISIKSPYFVINQSDIERLRSFPDEIENLKSQGYDGVIYANDSDIRKGVTGWGDDYAQYLVFSPNQIVSVFHPPESLKPILDKGRLDAPQEPSVCGIPVFHWSGAYFQDFEVSKDIGFHFGTYAAAMDRKGAYEVDVEVDIVMPGRRDYLCAEILEAPEPEALDERAYHLLMRKLPSPRLDLMDTLTSMNEIELEQVIDDHRDLEDTREFFENASRGQSGEYWQVSIEGEEIARTKDRKSALKKAAEAKASFMKEARLTINNPLRLPDLGTWASTEIASFAGLGHEFIDSLHNFHDAEEERYATIRRELKSRGYDGIVYTNETEDPGSDSYIAFDPDQIELVPSKLTVSQQKMVQSICLFDYFA